MDLERSRESSNVEDRRGSRMGRTAGGIGIGTIVLALVAMYFGVDPNVVIQGSQVLQGSANQAPAQTRSGPPVNDEASRFIRKVLGETEDVWGGIFQKGGSQYQQPKLVLFSGQTETACGVGQTATGPFYCPADRKVYLDLVFFDELARRFKAPGDFAQAYVIAHEVGHHVQNLLGISGKVDAARDRMSEVEFNKLSVRMELQADCLAGVWANHAQRDRKILQGGDLEEALNAATAIGDDRLQKQGRGYVVPDSFTHGTSVQRMRWFKVGFDNGNLKACDTFTAKAL
jgi:hypothetical protein